MFGVFVWHSPEWHERQTVRASIPNLEERNLQESGFVLQREILLLNLELILMENSPETLLLWILAWRIFFILRRFMA